MSPQSSACSEFDVAKITAVFLSSPIIEDPQGFTTGFVFLPTLSCISTAVLELPLSIEDLDLLRSEVLAHVPETLIHRSVCAASVILNGIERPGAEMRHSVVLGPRDHSPEIKREGTFHKKIEGSGSKSLCSSKVRSPA